IHEYEKVRIKCAALFEILNEMKSIEVLNLINQAFGNDYINIGIFRRFQNDIREVKVQLIIYLPPYVNILSILDETSNFRYCYEKEPELKS
ncbi:7720_t:CDS:1, partial [Gigaspora rosea]